MAQADQMGAAWIVTPICRECVLALARVYGITTGSDPAPRPLEEER
jgi:hypothetical protein